MSAAAAAADRPSNAPEACVGPASAEAGKASACDGCPNQSACASGEGRKVDPAVAEVQQRLAEVKHKILVLSGKGGVGQCGRRAVLLITRPAVASVARQGRSCAHVALFSGVCL